MPDTLQITRTFEKAGFERSRAEAVAEVVAQSADGEWRERVLRGLADVKCKLNFILVMGTVMAAAMVALVLRG